MKILKEHLQTYWYTDTDGNVLPTTDDENGLHCVNDPKRLSSM